MLDKLHVIADYEGRSANSQILYLIRKCIEEYETNHEKISFKRDDYKNPESPEIK